MAKGNVRFGVGSRVATRDGRVGIVDSLRAIKSGSPGRPKTVLTVKHDDDTTAEYGIAQLKTL